MPIFRPSARVRLQLRLDEFADTAATRGSLERTPPQGASFGAGALAASDAKAGLAANFTKRQQLESVRATIPPPQLAKERASLDRERTRLQRMATTGEAQEQPESLTEDAGDSRNVIFSVLPQHATVSRNGVKDADTATLTIDFRDVPIDPRVVRACLVTVAIGTADADDWEAGVLRQRQQEDGSLRSLVSRDPGQELRFNSSTTFVGFVDEWLVTFGDDGDTVRLQCRDIGALLRDQRLPSGMGIDLSVPIDRGVQALVDAFPASRGLIVKYGTPTDENDPLNTFAPESAPIPADSIPKVLKARKGKRSKGRRKGAAKQSVWDHIMDVCLKLGLVPMLRSFTLFLVQPRVLFSSFAGARRMVWGRNISELTIARKLGGVKSDTIEIRSPDPSIGRTRWARYPVLEGEPSSGILGKPGSPQPVVTRASNVSPNGMPDERVQVYTVRGVTDQSRLETIARETFEEIGRQEIEGSLKTDEIESFDTRTQGDLLLLQPGEPVTIEIAPPTEISSPETGTVAGQRASGNPGAGQVTIGSSLQELHAQAVAARADYLVRLGMAPETARRLAAAQEQVSQVSTFRAGHVNIDWSSEEGVSMEIDFHNFIVVRDSPDERDRQPTANTLAGGAEAASSGLGRAAGL